jgi:hypothetical protein
VLSINEPAIRLASALSSAVLTLNVLSLPTGNKRDRCRKHMQPSRCRRRTIRSRRSDRTETTVSRIRANEDTAVPHHVSRSATLRKACYRAGAGQVGPNILVELTDNKISPVAAGPFRGLLLEGRPTLTTPQTQELLFFADPKRYFEEVGVKHIVIVDKHEQTAGRLGDTTQSGGCKAESRLARRASVGMP